MLRLATIALLLGACTGVALAQNGNFPGVAPSVPSPFTSPSLLGGAPAPMQAVPSQRVSPNLGSSLSSPRVYTTRRGRIITVPPSTTGQDSFGDRASRCIGAGTAAGLGPNQVNAFAGRCAN
jgi:hypothetical protein